MRIQEEAEKWYYLPLDIELTPDWHISILDLMRIGVRIAFTL